MRTLAEELSKHAGVVLADGIMWCTCGADLWSHRTGFTAGALPIYGPVGEIAHTHHLAAVVAEWLESDGAVEAVAPVLEIAMRPDELVYEFQERQARAALAALAAHAKGEAS